MGSPGTDSISQQRRLCFSGQEGHTYDIEVVDSRQEAGKARFLSPERTMNRADALKQLKAHKARLSGEFGVEDIAVFDSLARDDAAAGSDIDILVRFDGPATSRRYFGLQFYLEDLLGCSVDLVTDKALRPELRPYIEREAVHV